MSENNIWKTKLFYKTKTLAYICLVRFLIHLKAKSNYKTESYFFIMSNT